MSNNQFLQSLNQIWNVWENDKYIDLKTIKKISNQQYCLINRISIKELYISFNCSDTSITKIKYSAEKGSKKAIELFQYALDNNLFSIPYVTISSEHFKELRKKLYSNPEKFMKSELVKSFYPYYSPGRTYGYAPNWVKKSIDHSKHLFNLFKKSKRSETAVLIGNGPSLNKIDFDLFNGQDVFLSNYAIKNEILLNYAKGVAVTNNLVAEQEPYWFSLNRIWKFQPLWLAYTLPQTENSILLNALGGDLFFSKNILETIAWHSTVSYFWLQILYSAGYRKVVMTGFDHFYHQNTNAQEGDLIHQTTDDKNHFDSNYFKGKKWQAADVGKMEETYRLAKKYYEADGREIINATVGGHLEVFRRSELVKEIPPRRIYGRIARTSSEPKIAIITSFWEGDIKQTELHWRLINRLSFPSDDHFHIFKHDEEKLQPSTLPRIIFASIEKEYPEASKLPHPAGPNLVFVHTIKLLLDTDYTHFFWLEPDCIPTDKNWLSPFINRLKEYPDEPIIGTGGGTVSPGKLHWRNHFAGCSLYSIKHLSELDWDSFIKYQLDVSFDVWLSVNLGYIKLNQVNNENKTDTIIFGKNRYDWTEMRKPKSLVYGMFEHWRPEKIMTYGQLQDRLGWPGFTLYHAIKDTDVIKKIYKRLPKSASTIIINYNNEKYLFEAIKSALNQTLNGIKYEVIVVDDGSTDSSKMIIEFFSDRIKTVFLSHGMLNSNFNQQRALKAGLEIAEGEILLLLDGDDVFYSNKVNRVCEAFDDPEVVICQHSIDLIDEKGLSLKKTFKAFPNETITNEIYKKLGRVNLYQSTSGLSFRRSYLMSQLSNLFVDNHLNTWLDVRLTRFAPYYGKIFSSRDCLGAWRRHSRSDSIRTDNIAERVEGHERWYDETALKMGFPTIPFSWKLSCNSKRPNKSKKNEILLGPYPRESHAHWDETLGVRQLIAYNKNGIMIDVGAHEGYALMPFLNDGWYVFAFEPDNKNRTKLLERLEKHKHESRIHIDSRCVSNKSKKGIPFFTSEQSTGISGLSAFHETHIESQKVDVTTLSDFFMDKIMPAVEFLKIDTEGYDLFVLQGYPWDRGKPAVIECEYEDLKTVPLGYTFHDLAGFLVDKGYTIYVSEWHPIIRYGIQHDWRQLKRYPCELADSKKGWGNLLAFRDPIDENELLAAISIVMKSNPISSENIAAAILSYKRNFWPGFWIENGKNYEKISNNQWLYTQWCHKHSYAQQKIWMAIAETKIETKKRTYICGVRLKSDRKMILNVILDRYGITNYEGVSEQVILTPGVEKEIKLYKKFSKSHLSIKFQIEVVELEGGGSSLLTIDKLYFYETLDSIKHRMDAKNITLSEGNRLFREGDLFSAMGIYMILYQKRPLPMYFKNAKLAIKKLNMEEEVGSVDDLLQRVSV